MFGVACLLWAGMTCGCSHVYVTVDARVDSGPSIQGRLDGPKYVIIAEDPRVEASLAFQAFSGIFERALAELRPGMHRVRSRNEADVVLTLVYNITDRGVGIGSYPVHGYSYGYVYGHRGAYRRGYDLLGYETYTYHLGYLHTLSVSAWVVDSDSPAGRRVLWEGRADHQSEERTLKVTMPYLAAALGRFYGEGTDRPTRIKLAHDDPLVLLLRTRDDAFLGPAMGASSEEADEAKPVHSSP